MAPIKEFSSADLNTISRLSGVSNVLVKVNGATVAASSFSGLLDTYTGAAAAYSVRKLDKDYTGSCMRIVVDSAATVGTLDSSDPEFDIGFDTNGDLDTAEIVTRCNNPSGTNYNAYVTKWYDQSGNGNDATQDQYTAMPQIASTGAVITENGKSALDFSNDYMDTPTITVTDGEFMQTAVYNNDTNVTNSAVVTMDTVPVRVAQTLSFSNSTTIRLLTFNSSGGVDAVIGASATTAGTQTLATSQVLNGQGEVFVNGSGALRGSVNVRTDQTTIRLGRNVGNYAMDGRLQEVIHWPSEQTNRSAIETDINNYFSIY